MNPTDLTPFYRRMIDILGLDQSILFDALEADLRYRLEDKSARSDPSLKERQVFVRHRNGVTSWLVDLEKYGECVLGKGPSAYETKRLHEDIASLRERLYHRLPRFYHRDQEAPPNTMAILTGKDDKEAIGVVVVE